MNPLGQAVLPLLGKRVTLSLPRAGDEDGLIAFYARNFDRLKPWLPRPGGDLASLSFWTDWITRSGALYQNGASCHLVMRLAGDQNARVIGQIDFSLILRGPLNSTMVGFQIDEEFEGRGLMSEGLRLSLSFVFGVLKLRRVIGAFVSDNVQSERLLTSLGFVYEGIARKFLEIEGVPRDHIVMALLSTDRAYGELS